jgi:hypothetical protein
LNERRAAVHEMRGHFQATFFGPGLSFLRLERVIQLCEGELTWGKVALLQIFAAYVVRKFSSA